MWPLVYFTALSNNASAPTIKAKCWLIQGSSFARQKTGLGPINRYGKSLPWLFSDGRLAIRLKLQSF
jgi:hypothetical protein